MHVMITGCRGIPAAHGGFETFAEDLALYLVARNHAITVYCQGTPGSSAHEDTWRGVRRVHIPAASGPAGTIWFDFETMRHALKQTGVVLTLGSNTGVFSYLLRLRGVPSAMNMDGIEWRREKWSLPQRMWLWLNERAGAHGSNRLIADHPEIKKYLERHTPAHKIAMIPYGADENLSGSPEVLEKYNLAPYAYYLLVARPEPENSILEIVDGYSRGHRTAPLVVLGNYNPETHPYHKRVIEAAGSNVRFIGGIYDRQIVQSLRFYAKGYLHGHRVGGTNPSLVESLAAGNAVIAHDNVFNRWVAGDGALYFQTPEDLCRIFERIDGNPACLAKMRKASHVRRLADFRQEHVLAAYERLLLRLAGEQPDVGKLQLLTEDELGCPDGCNSGSRQPSSCPETPSR